MKRSVSHFAFSVGVSLVTLSSFAVFSGSAFGQQASNGQEAQAEDSNTKDSNTNEVSCDGTDMGTKIKLICGIAYQGITADSTNLFKPLAVEHTCNEYDAFKTTASLSIVDPGVSATLTAMNGSVAMFARARGGQTSGIRMSRSALEKHVTLQVPLPEMIRTPEGDRIQDIAFTCRIQTNSSELTRTVLPPQ